MDGSAVRSIVLVGEDPVLDRVADGVATRLWRLPACWVSSAAVDRLSSRSGQIFDRLWVLPWRNGGRTAFHLLQTLGPQPALVYSNDATFRKRARNPFVLAGVRQAADAAGCVRHWSPAIRQVLAAPWVSTGRALSRALVHLVPDDELWQGLTQADHEVLLYLALDVSSADLRAIARALHLGDKALRQQCSRLCEKLGAEDIRDLGPTYRRLAGWAVLEPAVRQERASSSAARFRLAS